MFPLFLCFAHNSSSLIRLLSNTFLPCWFFFLQMFLPCVVFYKTYFIHSRHLHNIFLPCSFKKKGSCYFLLAVYTHYIIRLHNMFLPCKFRKERWLSCFHLQPSPTISAIADTSELNTSFERVCAFTFSLLLFSETAVLTPASSNPY